MKLSFCCKGILVALLVFGAGHYTAGAETVTDSYPSPDGTVVATITVPDGPVSPGVDFDVTVEGVLVGGSGWSVTSYAVYEDAEWIYDANHMVELTPGTKIDGSGFHWGNTFTATYTIDKPAGTYTYTFVFGNRTLGHGYYDVAVDAKVTVADAPSVCGFEWLPPLNRELRPRAGRVIPLKFTAIDCETGTFIHDADVLVQIDGGAIEWAFTGNPHTGIAIGNGKYHVNWDTDRDGSGEHTITVVFGTGDVFTKVIDVAGAARKLALAPGGAALALSNHPNPFNPTTSIRYTLPEPSEVVLSVYNVRGQKIRVLVHSVQAAGQQAVPWDGRDAAGHAVSSGLYLYRLKAGPQVAVGRMVMMK